jgi:hypothetical protein
MRALLVLGALVAATTANASESMRVDGVRVYGRIHEVSLGDIRAAIADFVSTASDKSKPAALEVVSSTEMRAYEKTHDWGWVAVRRIPSVDPGHRNEFVWWTWRRAIDDAPDLLRFIKSANEVYVFPVPTPLKPHRDDKHLRLLDAEARRQVTRLLGDRETWWHGLYTLVVIDDGKPGIGLLFRRGRSEAVLFFSHFSDEEGTFDGEHISGLLDDDRGRRQMKEWEHRYAQPELTAKSGLTNR